MKLNHLFILYNGQNYPAFAGYRGICTSFCTTFTLKTARSFARSLMQNYVSNYV